MADSQLSTQVKATKPTGKVAWGEREAAVEVLYNAITNLGVAPVNTTADAGSDSTKVVGVQGVSGGKTIGVTPAAGELHLGEVSTPSDVISVTPVCDTSAYASGDTLFDSTTITNAVRVTTGQAILQTLTVIDKDDQTAAAMTVYIMDTTGLSFGTANAAPGISAANATKILGVVAIASGDWNDVGNAKVANIRGIGMLVEATSGRNLAFAATTGGSPTQTASGLVFRFGFLW